MTVCMHDVESRITVTQLTHEPEKHGRRMNRVPVHVQNDVAPLQTDIRCGRSDPGVHYDHSVFSRQAGNPYSPNFGCPLRNGRGWRRLHGSLNSYCLDSTVSIDCEDECLSITYISQERIQFSL